MNCTIFFAFRFLNPIVAFVVACNVSLVASFETE